MDQKPALDDDDDVIDAEIVETPAVAPFSAGLPGPDYSDAGVPSLDYVRDRIEGRFATATGSSELAEAEAGRQAAVRADAEKKALVTAEEQRAARERAAADRLEEIRRSLHP